MKHTHAIWCKEKQRYLRGSKLWRWTRFARFGVIGTEDKCNDVVSIVRAFQKETYGQLSLEVVKLADQIEHKKASNHEKA